MQTNTELQKKLKASYINSKDMIKLIKKYKLARKPDIKESYRQLIFDNNIRFIRKMVSSKRSMYQNDDLEDVFNSATVAFFEGLEKFNPNKGFQFSTYIGYWIQKSMHDYFYERNIVHIPKGSFDKKRPLVTMRAAKASNFSLTYLDAPISFSDSDPRINSYDLIEDKNSINPEDEIINKVYEEQLLRLVNKLNPKEQIVIKHRIFNDIPLTLSQVGEIIGVRTERARQIESRALWKLKAMLRAAKQHEISRIVA